MSGLDYPGDLIHLCLFCGPALLPVLPEDHRRRLASAIDHSEFLLKAAAAISGSVVAVCAKDDIGTAFPGR